MTWGYHMVVDASRCKSEAIRDASTIASFARDLVTAIDMVAHGDPQVIHFGTGNKAGYTLVQLIETSNVSAHFVEETNDVYLDVFSCKLFDRQIVEEVFMKYFGTDATFMHVRILLRQAGDGR
jgi:S-adenosylmethionine/arginine decarboxylase-like enzyme